MWKVSSRRSFRLSEKATKNLEAYTNNVTKTNDNNSLNVILENLSEAPETPKQSEQTQKKERREDFLQLPPFLRCPYLLEVWEETAKVLRECPTCNWKKHCPAWKGTITQLPLIP